MEALATFFYNLRFRLGTAIVPRGADGFRIVANNFEHACDAIESLLNEEQARFEASNEANGLPVAPYICANPECICND